MARSGELFPLRQHGAGQVRHAAAGHRDAIGLEAARCRRYLHPAGTTHRTESDIARQHAPHRPADHGAVPGTVANPGRCLRLALCRDHAAVAAHRRRAHRVAQPPEGGLRPAGRRRHRQGHDRRDPGADPGPDRRRRVLALPGQQPGRPGHAGPCRHVPPAQQSHRTGRGRRPLPSQAAAAGDHLPAHGLRPGIGRGCGPADRGAAERTPGRGQGSGPAQGCRQCRRQGQPRRSFAQRPDRRQRGPQGSPDAVCPQGRRRPASGHGRPPHCR